MVLAGAMDASSRRKGWLGNVQGTSKSAPTCAASAPAGTLKMRSLRENVQELRGREQLLPRLFVLDGFAGEEVVHETILSLFMALEPVQEAICSG